ncbi:hypothetical protein GCM10022403_033830 [Streptomyces coacervatus]|uniref:Uncharacterized protein n=1 Tax=Streptomyces coacervatus TaxID=647381 RepID=A0ABP7HNZ3_9ACTN
MRPGPIGRPSTPVYWTPHRLACYFLFFGTENEKADKLGNAVDSAMTDGLAQEALDTGLAAATGNHRGRYLGNPPGCDPSFTSSHVPNVPVAPA